MILANLSPRSKDKNAYPWVLHCGCNGSRLILNMSIDAYLPVMGDIIRGDTNVHANAKETTFMATIPTKQTASAPRAETVLARFRRLQAEWTSQVGHLSSYTAIVQHPAFREIISMGEAVVPLMLRDLQERPQLWVWALPEITGADPVSPDDAGKIAKMSEAWLHWGREHGYQW